jgi:hypothetical protein
VKPAPSFPPLHFSSVSPSSLPISNGRHHWQLIVGHAVVVQPLPFPPLTPIKLQAEPCTLLLHRPPRLPSSLRRPWNPSPPRAPRIKTKTHVYRCSPSSDVRSPTDRNNSNHGEKSHPLCTTTGLQCLRRSGAPRGEAEAAHPLQLLVAAHQSMSPKAARAEHHRSV